MQRYNGGYARICRMMMLAAICVPCLCVQAIADDTLYQQLGGQAGIVKIVEETVALFTEDNRVKAEFDNINLDRLKRSLADFLCHLTNGPCVYHGRSMAAAHEGLELNRAKFNAVAEDLQTAMEQTGIPYWTQNRLMALLAPLQRDVVTR